jgi:hypothetical protein
MICDELLRDDLPAALTAVLTAANLVNIDHSCLAVALSDTVCLCFGQHRHWTGIARSSSRLGKRSLGTKRALID